MKYSSTRPTRDLDQDGNMTGTVFNGTSTRTILCSVSSPGLLLEKGVDGTTDLLVFLGQREHKHKFNSYDHKEEVDLVLGDLPSLVQNK